MCNGLGVQGKYTLTDTGLLVMCIAVTEEGKKHQQLM